MRLLAVAGPRVLSTRVVLRTLLRQQGLIQTLDGGTSVLAQCLRKNSSSLPLRLLPGEAIAHGHRKSVTSAVVAAAHVAAGCNQTTR